MQVTAREGLELERAFQPEQCAKTHQRFPSLPGAVPSFLHQKASLPPGSHREQPLAAGVWLSRDENRACALLAFWRVTWQPPQSGSCKPISAKPHLGGCGGDAEIVLLVGDVGQQHCWSIPGVGNVVNVAF